MHTPTMMWQATEIVIERIARAVARAPTAIVAFDADGTLWSGDVGEDLLDAIARDDALLAAARARIAATTDERADSERAHFEMTGWALAGRSNEEVSAYVERIASQIGLEDRIQRETWTVLDALAHLGVDVFVVSASPRAMVEACLQALRHRALDRRRVIATTAIMQRGRMMADVERPIPFGDGKAEALRRAAGERTIVAAFGDSDFDAPMLRLAEIPVAVRPKAKLVDLAPTIPGLVGIEPCPSSVRQEGTLGSAATSNRRSRYP